MIQNSSRERNYKEMIFCKKCGAQIADDSEFCPHCGTSQDAQTTPTAQGWNRKMHCPRCKSRAISPVVETVGSNGGAYQLSGRVTTGYSQNINQTSWLCKDCGTKFRNIDELEKEAQRFDLCIKMCAVFTIVLVLMAILMAKTFAPMLILVVPAGILFAALTLYSYVMSKKRHKELDYLQINCFN